MTKLPWPTVQDGDYVERLIPAIQRAIADTSARGTEAGNIEVSAPDLANALLLLLASVLEPAPACATPRGMREMAEDAARELLLLMKDARRFREGEGTA